MYKRQVFMCGGDLFTSNAMIMTIGALEKKVTWLDALLVNKSPPHINTKVKATPKHAPINIL